MCYTQLVINQVDSTSFFNTYKNIIIPDCQRILDLSKLNDIVNYQVDMYIKYNTFKFIGVITLCHLKDKSYLIDGQHRYHSMKMLYEKYNSTFDIHIQNLYVNKYEELKEIYDTINKNTPLPNIEFCDKNEKNILEDACFYFAQHYPQVWSKSMRSRRPFIFYNSFQESLSFILKHMVFDNSQQFIDILMKYNYSIASMKMEQIKGVNESMYNKAKEWGFYLGLYSFDINQEYGFEWAKSVVEYHCPGVKIQKTKSPGTVIKKHISKSLKSKIWNHYIGVSIGQISCIVCKNNTINMMNFECGHIIAESCGGKNNIDNLIPICGLCNKSMGTTNMEIYVSEHFPENLNGFRSRFFD